MVMALPEPVRRSSATVRLALVLMALSALLAVALVVMFLRDYVTYADSAVRAGHNIGASQARVKDDIIVQHQIDGLSAGAFGLLALALAGTTVWARRSNAGRVLACLTAAGQALCCTAIMAWLSLNVSLLDAEGSDPYYDESFRVQYAAQPGWAKLLIPTATALLPLIGITVLVLLLVPSSNRFYRKAPTSTSPPAYPLATPGYGPAPGYPPPPPPGPGHAPPT